MRDSDLGQRIAITRGGRFALDLLESLSTGHVGAMFDHSFYLSFDTNWICVGTRNLPMGPLSLRTNVSDTLPWHARGVRLDEFVDIKQKTIFIGDILSINFDQSPCWEPPSPLPWNKETLAQGLAAIDRLSIKYVSHGLGQFIRTVRPDDDRGEIVKAAAPSIEGLYLAVQSQFRGESKASVAFEAAVRELIGFGPGLTPSGDDFLCGMLITLNALDALQIKTQLAACIKMHAPERTNALSTAHMQAAGRGATHSTLHEVLICLLSGKTKTLPAKIVAVDGIGHTSGYDALAGICVTLRAYLAGSP